MDLSVIIPSRNAAHTLRPLLVSLSLQTLKSDRFEVLLMDDGSTDSTPEVAAEFPFVRHIPLATNSGPGAARNLGMSQCRGGLILFLDADLMAPPHLLESHLRFHQANPGISAAGGSVVPAKDRWFSWALADHYSTWFNAHPGTQYPTAPEYLPSLNFSVKTNSVRGGTEIRWADGLKHTGEDVVFCHELRSRGHRLGYISDAWVRHEDRDTLKGFLKHQYRFGHHAPFVRGSIPGLKYGFLFPKSRVFLPFTLPAIVFGYAALTWKSWAAAQPLKVSASLPQIFLGKLAYAFGVAKGTSELARSSRGLRA